MSGDGTVIRRRDANRANSDDRALVSGDGDQNLKTKDRPEKDLSPKPKRLRPEWTTYADLSTFETWFYIVCAVFSTFYACYRVLRLSPTAFRMLADHHALRRGQDRNFELAAGFWRKVAPVRDNTNSEWSVLLWYMSQMWKHYLLHLVASTCLRRFGVSNRIRLFLLSLHCLVAGASILKLKVILSQFLYAFTALVLAKLTKTVLSSWALSVFGLVLLNFPDGVPYMNGFSLFYLVFDYDFHYETYFVWVITLANTFNRTTSFCHEILKRNFANVEDPKRQPQSFLLLTVDLFNYIYYLPLLITGPLMTYDKFEENVTSESRQNESPKPLIPLHLKLNLERENLKFLAKFLLNILRMLFWLLITEVIVHRMYFGVMLKQINFLRDSVDLWELAGIGFASGQFFYLKYLQMYGIHSLIAHLDGMTPPGQPKCISRVYLYSDMFRNFDTGLYNFIKRHLYIPLGGSHHGFTHQLLTSAIVYSFIYFWHGSEYYIVLWTLFNFTTINMETVGRYMLRKPWVQEIEAKLGPRMWRRLRVALSTPLFIASTIAIFMFIGSTEEVLYVYVDRFFGEGVKSGGLFLVFFFMYTIAQTSVTAFKREERHLVEKTAPLS